MKIKSRAGPIRSEEWSFIINFFFPNFKMDKLEEVR